MQMLFLTLQQAKELGDSLVEYSDMQDSSNRDLFKGFKISFDDLFSIGLESQESFELTPIPEFIEIDKDKP